MNEMPLWVALVLGFFGFLCLVAWPAVIIAIAIIGTSDSYEAYHDDSEGGAA